MNYEAAPLEGITDAVFRRTHAAFYPGIARYYTPFISPTMHHVFTPRDLRELAPENNSGLKLVPQLLGRNPCDLLWAIEELSAMGYEEVDLNLGCPSGTVTAKRKGSGLLAFPEELDALLHILFSSSPIRISVKTRLGLSSPGEFERILSIYNKHPICRLIIHPRTRDDQYTGPVHWYAFGRALENTSLPVTYNGDLFTVSDVERFREAFPSVESVMLGRGLIADPALVVKLNGGADDPEKLKDFLRTLSEEYVRVFGDKHSAMHRMKAIWAHVLPRLPDGEACRKRLVKTRRWEDYLTVTEDLYMLI